MAFVVIQRVIGKGKPFAAVIGFHLGEPHFDIHHHFQLGVQAIDLIPQIGDPVLHLPAKKAGRVGMLLKLHLAQRNANALQHADALDIQQVLVGIKPIPVLLIALGLDDAKLFIMAKPRRADAAAVGKILDRIAFHRIPSTVNLNKHSYYIIVCGDGTSPRRAGRTFCRLKFRFLYVRSGFYAIIQAKFSRFFHESHIDLRAVSRFKMSKKSSIAFRAGTTHAAPPAIR